VSSSCLRAQERFADLIDGSLAAPLERQLQEHLRECSECNALLVSYREVVAALRSFSAPEMSGELTRKIVASTRNGRRRSRHAVWPTAFPVGWTARAGALAAAAVLVLLVWRPPAFVSGVSDRVSVRAHQAYSFGVRSYHQTARWLEELNVLRMTVGVAFEDRLDRLNERLQDLDEARRRTGDEPASEQSNNPIPGLGQRASSIAAPPSELSALTTRSHS
jgi:hypothetical protein